MEHLHFIGIGGIGVSAVARLALGKGCVVSGSDVRESQLTRAMAELGAAVAIGHDPKHIAGADRVVVSTAIPDDNVELRAAVAQGIPVVHRSALLAQLAGERRCIGVTGTHGKGTVSAMIAWILDCAGRDPGFAIGGLLNNYGINARWGSSEWMVLEVDESDGSHHRLFTEVMVCNFLEPDHLNYYEDLDDIIRSMASYIEGNPHLASPYVNGDCSGNRRLEALVGRPFVRYGLGDGCDVRGRIDGRGQFPIRFEVFRRGQRLGEAELAIPGRYNVTNALGALAVTLDLGVAFPVAAEALSRFQGLENRFSIVQAGDITIVKDYISHPTGIRRVLESATDLTSGRIFSVWKPYRYTLLSYLGDEYANAFEGSHEVLITTMYAAEEDPIPGVDTEFIVRKIRDTGMSVTFVPHDIDLIGALERRLEPGDKVIFFGGDDFFEMADAWADRLGLGNRGAHSGG